MHRIQFGCHVVNISIFHQRGGPVAWYFLKRIDAPFVDIDVVARCFMFGGVAAFVGVNGMLGDVFDVFFVKNDHFGWQGKNGHSIDTAMPEEAPFGRSGSRQQE